MKIFGRIWAAVMVAYIGVWLKVVSVIMQHLVSIEAPPPSVKPTIDTSSNEAEEMTEALALDNIDDGRKAKSALMEQFGQAGQIKRVWPKTKTSELLLDKSIMDVISAKGYPEYYDARDKAIKSKSIRRKLKDTDIVNEAIDQLIDLGQYWQACHLDEILHRVMAPVKTVRAAKINKKRKAHTMRTEADLKHANKTTKSKRKSK